MKKRKRREWTKLELLLMKGDRDSRSSFIVIVIEEGGKEKIILHYFSNNEQVSIIEKELEEERNK